MEAGLIGKPKAVAPNASYAMGQTFVAGVPLPDMKKKKPQAMPLQEVM